MDDLIESKLIMLIQAGMGVRLHFEQNDSSSFVCYALFGAPLKKVVVASVREPVRRFTWAGIKKFANKMGIKKIVVDLK